MITNDLGSFAKAERSQVGSVGYRGGKGRGLSLLDFTCLQHRAVMHVKPGEETRCEAYPIDPIIPNAIFSLSYRFTPSGTL